MLAPDVVVRADQAAQRLGSLPVIRGATAVAESFKGRAQAARPALVDGAIGVLPTRRRSRLEEEPRRSPSLLSSSAADRFGRSGERSLSGGALLSAKDMGVDGVGVMASAG